MYIVMQRPNAGPGSSSDGRSSVLVVFIVTVVVTVKLLHE